MRSRTNQVLSKYAAGVTARLPPEQLVTRLGSASSPAVEEETGRCPDQRGCGQADDGAVDDAREVVRAAVNPLDPRHRGQCVACGPDPRPRGSDRRGERHDSRGVTRGEGGAVRATLGVVVGRDALLGWSLGGVVVPRRSPMRPSAGRGYGHGCAAEPGCPRSIRSSSARSSSASSRPGSPRRRRSSSLHLRVSRGST